MEKQTTYQQIANAASTVHELHKTLKASGASNEDVQAVLWHAVKLWELAGEHFEDAAA